MTDFFIVGAVKAGTTSLHQYLAQHPSIEMSRTKWTRFFHVDGAEPDFHQLALRNGRGLLGESVWRFRTMCHPAVPRTLEAYLLQWATEPGEKSHGEVSPTYMYDEYACARIKKRFPDARIIAVLRMPVQRATSHFAMDRASNWVPERTFIEAVRREPYRIDSFWWGLRHYLRHGFYARYVDRMHATFGASNLKIMLYDDLISEPRAFMDQITDFLGIERFEFDLSAWHNAAPIEKAVLAADEFAELARLYEAETMKLQDIVGRDLGHWLQA